MFSAELPRYEELYQSLVGGKVKPSINLKRSLGSMYACVFEFLDSVVRVFSDRCGSKRALDFTIINWETNVDTELKKKAHHHGQSNVEAIQSSIFSCNSPY